MESESVCEYDGSNAKGDSLSCPTVESRYFFTRFKTLKYLSPVACRGWHCKQNFQNAIDIWKTIFFYKFQCLTTMAWVYLVCGIKIPPCFSYVYLNGKLFMSLQICPISIINLNSINK